MHYGLFRGACIVGATAIALMAVGCGPRKFNVSGKVTYNGAVLDKPNGKIIFVGPQSEQVEASINPDGSYQASGVTEGMNKVVVYYPNPRLQSEKPAKPHPGDKVEKMKPLPPANITPDKYSAPDKSGLSLTVDKDSLFDVDMTGPPIKQP